MTLSRYISGTINTGYLLKDDGKAGVNVVNETESFGWGIVWGGPGHYAKPTDRRPLTVAFEADARGAFAKHALQLGGEAYYT